MFLCVQKVNEMFIHDFNTQGNNATIEYVDGERIRITRGELPNGVQPAEYERVFYIPEHVQHPRL